MKKLVNYDIVEMLLAFGCDINAIDKDGDTPLITAVMIQSYKIVKLLMDANADTTIENNMGRTVFSLAYNNRTHNESSKKIFQYIKYLLNKFLNDLTILNIF